MGFPKGFFWGGAVAANQCEGAWNVGGRGLAKTDVTTGGTVSTPRMVTYIDKDGNPQKAPSWGFALPEGAKFAVLDTELYPNHDGIDFYNRYAEDIALFKEMGFNIFRMSIAWPRIFPNAIETEPSKEGLDFYRRVFEELKKNDIEPLVTISHYDDPLYIEEHLGGWANPEVIGHFEKYCKVIFEEYKDLVKYWLTFNELNGETMHATLPGLPLSQRQAAFKGLHNHLVASAKVVKYAHDNYPQFVMGNMMIALTNYPLTSDPKDVLATEDASRLGLWYTCDVQVRGAYGAYCYKIWDKYELDPEFFLKDADILKEGKVDLLTFSYYSTSAITTHEELAKKAGGNVFGGCQNPYVKYSEWGWAMDPDLSLIHI